MRLPRPFVRLPLLFDAGALAAEVATVPDDAWRPLPGGLPGTSIVPLVCAGGDPANEALDVPMLPTPILHDLTAVANVLATLTALGCAIGRTRLLRVDGRSEEGSHVDATRYGWDHLQIDVPVRTDPSIVFRAGEDSAHMAAGEAWAIDSWSGHRVENPAGASRIHLVIDTVGGPGLWSAIDRETGATPPGAPVPATGPADTVSIEAVGPAPVMSSAEIDATIDALLDEYAGIDAGAAAAIARDLLPFRRGWRAAWALYSTAEVGLAEYQRLLDDADSTIASSTGHLANGITVADAIRALVLEPALSPALLTSDPRAFLTWSSERAAAHESDGVAPPGLESGVTPMFSGILEHADVTIAVTSQQSGRLVFIRRDGDRVNTLMRSFDRPTGLAVRDSNLAIGARTSITAFMNRPSAASTIDPSGRTDACFVPQQSHISGDLHVHDLAFDGEGMLWAVATRFSCLVTFDIGTSFTPRWRPPFVSSFTADDPCHLNGLAMVDGRPKYVTMLAMTDEPVGWRKQDAAGGAILDVDTGDAIATGLSAPHSPRWYAGKLWMLESGRGALCTVDVETGEVTTVATVPGFARGLAFAGDLAFIGVSKVRASVFGDLPIVAAGDTDNCGVWVVDTNTGVSLGHLRFTGSIEEIYEVASLPGLAFPDLLEPGAEQLDDLIVVDDRFVTDGTGWSELPHGSR